MSNRSPVDRERLTGWDSYTALHSAHADRDNFACGRLDALADCTC